MIKDNDGWISVNDRLPIEGQKVIVIQNPNTTATREPLFAIFDAKNQRFMPSDKYDNPIDEFGGRVLGWSDIIYWQPLPSPPKNQPTND